MADQTANGEKSWDCQGFAHEFGFMQIIKFYISTSVMANNILYCSWQHRTTDDHNMEFVRFSQQFADFRQPSTCPRPRLPFSLLGVPTQTSEMSPNFSSSRSACRRPASTPRRIRSSKPGSILGLLPELIRDNSGLLQIHAGDAVPFQPNTPLSRSPRYPIPKTVIFIREAVAAL